MENKNNITKDIFRNTLSSITFKHTNMPPSYTWDKKRSSFSLALWPEIMYDLICKKVKTGDLEKYWINRDANRTNKGSTNSMYISVLKNRLLLNGAGGKGYSIYDELNKYSIKSVKKEILNYINEIVNEHALEDIVKEWQREYLMALKSVGSYDEYVSTSTNNIIDDDVPNYENEISNGNVEYHYTDAIDEYREETPSRDDESDYENINHEKIGFLGEKIVWHQLKKKYNDVVWEYHEGRKYSKYDLSYIDNGQKYFVEVKSSTNIRSTSFKYYISSREVKFAKENNDKYQIIFVNGILRGKKNGWIKPEITIIDKPNFIIDKIAKEKNDLIIQPIKFVGYKKMN